MGPVILPGSPFVFNSSGIPRAGRRPLLALTFFLAQPAHNHHPKFEKTAPENKHFKYFEGNDISQWRNPGYCSEQVSIDSRVLQDLDSDSNDKTRRKIAININIGPFHNGEIARRFISQLLWRTSGLEFQPKRHQVSLWLIEKRPKKVLEQIATGRQHCL